MTNITGSSSSIKGKLPRMIYALKCIRNKESTNGWTTHRKSLLLLKRVKQKSSGAYSFNSILGLLSASTAPWQNTDPHIFLALAFKTKEMWWQHKKKTGMINHARELCGYESSDNFKIWMRVRGKSELMARTAVPQGTECSRALVAACRQNGRHLILLI